MQYSNCRRNLWGYCIEVPFFHLISYVALSQHLVSMNRSEHITDALISVHWLRVPERVQFKIAVLTYKVLHGTAQRYLGPLDRVADLPTHSQTDVGFPTFRGISYVQPVG